MFEKEMPKKCAKKAADDPDEKSFDDKKNDADEGKDEGQSQTEDGLWISIDAISLHGLGENVGAGLSNRGDRSGQNYRFAVNLDFLHEIAAHAKPPRNTEIFEVQVSDGITN